MNNITLFFLILLTFTECKLKNSIMKKATNEGNYSVNSRAINRMLSEMKWEKLDSLSVSEFIETYLLENKSVLIVPKFGNTGKVYSDITEYKRVVFDSEDTTSINKRIYPFDSEGVENLSLISERLSKALNVKVNALDCTIKSLEILDNKVNKLDVKKRVEQILYKDLISYCLYVLNNEVRGKILMAEMEGQKGIYVPKIVTSDTLIYTPVGELYDELISTSKISMADVIDAQLFKYKF